jgi:peptidoglycan/xylan/chitin deacetylase (PgdA/CDA1 family)
MNWEEARDLLARGHAVGCHTSSHRRFRGPAANGDFEREIAGAKASMEDALGARVASYAWVGGETDTYSAPAYGSIASAGFALAFTTKSLAAVPGANPLSIHRTVVDADMDIGAFALKASGLMDPIKAADRRTIEGRFS